MFLLLVYIYFVHFRIHADTDIEASRGLRMRGMCARERALYFANVSARPSQCTVCVRGKYVPTV